MKVLLKASKLRKTFRDPAEIHILNGVDLEVREGETIAITGASGEGKSTLLQILGTLETPCSGTLEIAGQQVTKRNAARLRNQQIGFIFQSFHLLEDYTTIENVLMPARIGRKNVGASSKACQRAEELLAKVGLSERADFHTKFLSGGEKQRVAVARALCNDPSLILADEPSGNLDHINSSHMHELLISLAAEENKGLVIVTHDQELAKLCQRHYVLKSGTLQLQ